MGSRAADSDKMHTRALKRKIKKDREATTCYRRAFGDEVKVIESFDAGPVLIAKVKNKINNKVASIFCPKCGQIAKWNAKWRAFICWNPQHKKRRAIYEIVR